MPITINGTGPVTGITSINTAVSDTEIGYLDGVTSALQTQINTKPTGTTGAWTAYTPSLTALTTSPTLGTGSTTIGAYVQIGKLVIVRLRIAFGSSGVAVGSGEYGVSLPVAANVTNYTTASGGLNINDNSANIFRAARPLGWHSNTTAALAIDSTTTGTYMITNSNPWTWAALDEIGGQIIYEAA